jgi:predicted PurR-regulated permease PerM
MLIFRFPNAPIISVLIAVTALVPVVGAFAGVSVGFLLILITNPIKALLFVAFVLVLQQIEGNFIYPKVVGKAVGLPAVIVISAVLVGGNVGGILGALLGVPISALAYTLLKEAIDNRTKNPKKSKKEKQKNRV